MADIFISYNREDAAIARLFRDALVDEGLDVWWDDDLRAGVSYDEVTEAALRSSKAVVVLWSTRSTVSRWVRSEAALALSKGSFMPVMIEACERPIMFELTQTPDLIGWRGSTSDPRWQRFVGDLRRHLSGDNVTEPEAPRAVQLARGASFALPDKPSIAVLPFTDLDNSDDHVFADGIVEEISTALGRFQTLFVTAGASSLTYRDPAIEPARICRELGVRYLLNGSVRRSGQRVRITVKLVDGIAGNQIWADKFDDTLDDIFELQDRVAMAVAARIDSSIDTAELVRVRNVRPGSADTYELYWKANALFRKMDPISLNEAIALTEKVLELDPHNAWAASLCSFCHATLFANGTATDPMASRTRALELYEVALRDGGADIRVLGYCSAALTSAAGDPEIARRLVERALEINPGSATNLFWGGWNDIILGNPARAYERMERALQLNPMSIVRPITITAMGICRLFQKEFGEATDILLETAHQIPHFPAAWAALTAAAAQAGRVADAKAARLRLRAVHDSLGVLALIRAPEQLMILREGLQMADALVAEEGSTA
jgi:TolB-like protein